MESSISDGAYPTKLFADIQVIPCHAYPNTEIAPLRAVEGLFTSASDQIYELILLFISLFYRVNFESHLTGAWVESRNFKVDKAI